MSSSTLTLHDLHVDDARLVERDQLFVILQGDRPGDGSSRHLLAGIEEVIIGRGDTRCATRARPGVLELRLPDTRMSSTHARLCKRSDGYWLEDAGSKNGSRLDGATTRRGLLRDGAILELGLTTLLFRQALPSREAGDEDLWLRPTASTFATLVPAIARDLDGLTRISRSSVPVLLLGETGTGKEVTARAVHLLSGRSGPFVPVNCAAIPETLVEATLFGHKRGAYSGAVTDNPGLVRSAEGGSLLLDEIGDLPLSAQGALLRMLQEGEVLAVGASRPAHADVRILAATHRPMVELVAQGKVREDLYARLSGFVLTLPPLRNRKEDLGLLVGALLARQLHESGRQLTLAAGTMALLLRHSWPRNVRELEKWIARCAALRDDDILRPEGLGDRDGLPVSASPGTSAEELRRAPDEQGATRADVEAALRKHQGNLAAVATSFRTSRSQVHRWLKRFGLNADDFRA
jgi:transcriptional regulator with PAS, ATPase and Fis domain